MTATDRTTRDRGERLPLSLRDQLVGAWHLVGYTLTGADGNVEHPMGEHAAGMLLCTPDGYTSVQLAGGDQHGAWTGRVHVDEDAHTVRHQKVVEMGTAVPSSDQEQHVALDGDAVTFSWADPSSAERTARLTWRRAGSDQGATPAEPV